jgi:hypothetical protein
MTFKKIDSQCKGDGFFFIIIIIIIIIIIYATWFSDSLTKLKRPVMRKVWF